MAKSLDCGARQLSPANLTKQHTEGSKKQGHLVPKLKLLKLQSFRATGKQSLLTPQASTAGKQTSP